MNVTYWPLVDWFSASSDLDEKLVTTPEPPGTPGRVPSGTRSVRTSRPSGVTSFEEDRRGDAEAAVGQRRC